MPNGSDTHKIDARWAVWSQSLPESLAWFMNVNITAVSITKKNAGWSLRLQATKKGQPVVAWFDAPAFYATYVLLGAAIKRGEIRWYPDRYPPNMGD
jgi:methionyl-tRNA synthetase